MIDNKDKQKDKDKDSDNFYTNTLHVLRTAKTRSGGKTNSFNAIVVVGDKKFMLGVAKAKASSASDAIAKARVKAKKNMFKVSLKNNTLAYPLICKFKSTKVLLFPASTGTGIIAMQRIKYIFQAIETDSILSKIYGSTNPIHVVPAVVNGLKSIKTAGYFTKKRGYSSRDEMLNHEKS
jgi:small subunit ribosomal protein S5